MAKTSPSIEAVFPDIVSRVASGELLTDLCKEYGFTRAWAYAWMNADKSRVDAYARAREEQQHAWADEIVKIAGESERDTIERDDGGTSMNSEWVARCKLKIDTKKWLMARLNPKAYGDKIQTEVSGKDGGPLVVKWEK
jgi:hypothetical protein